MAERQGLRFAPAPGTQEEAAPAPPPPSQESAPVEERRNLQFGDANAPTAKKPMDWQDIGMSAATRAGKAAPGVLIGGIGSIESTVGDVGKGIRNLYQAGRERLDLISPEEKERLQAEPLREGMNEGQLKGYNAPWSDKPTYKGVTETIGKIAPVLDYKSKTPEGKIAGEAAEFAVQGMNPVGLAGDVARGVAGVTRMAAPGSARAAAKDIGTSFATGAVGGAGGAGGEIAAQAAEKQGTDQDRARLVGSLSGAVSTGVLMHVGNAFLRPGSVAQNKLMDNVFADISRGESPMTVEQFNTAIRNGTPVTVLDLAGPRTTEFLSKYAEYNNTNINQIMKLNKFLNDRLPEGNARIQGTINQQYGRDVGNSLSAPGMTESMERAGKIERDKMYNLLREHPNAQTISVDELGDIRNNRVWREAEKFAKDAANHEEWGIQVPRKTAEVPSVPGSILDEYGQPIMKPGAAATETPGNLAYYDQIKRGLDGIIAKAEAANDKNTLVQATAAKNKLVDLLDKKVPDTKVPDTGSSSGFRVVDGYGKTRDLASETFKAASAPEAGYKFFGAQNAYRRQDIEKVLATYSPEQRQLFSAGYAARLNEIAGQQNGVRALADKFLTDRNFQERSRIALGQEAYDTFRGKAFSENLLRNAEQINFLGAKPANTAAFGVGAGSVGATGMTALDFLMHNFSSDTAGRAAVAAVGAAALGAGFNAAERRMATQLIPMAAKTDAKSMTEFVRLLDGSPMARQVFNKMNTALNTAQQQAVKGYLAQPDQPQQRKLGGRAGYAAGGSINHEASADRLISAAERAHKGWQAETKPLLGASDNTIARALEIANANT